MKHLGMSVGPTQQMNCCIALLQKISLSPSPWNVSWFEPPIPTTPPEIPVQLHTFLLNVLRKGRENTSKQTVLCRVHTYIQQIQVECLTVSVVTLVVTVELICVARQNDRRC